MAPQGIAQFGSVPLDSVISATYTHAHGISPGVCNLTVKLNTPISLGGDLQFRFGTKQVTFRDCRADLANLEITGDGHHWQVQILDRRWKWRFGEINGFYNRHDDRNNVVERSEKTPQELATLLLDAMGESGVDVAVIPNGPRPLVEWISANPAEELSRLCEELGCRIALQLDNKVRLHRIGVGKQLAGIVPSVTMSSGRGIDPAEKPDTIKVIGDETLFQVEMSMEAVGLETDGSIKKIDDLSYKPLLGWERASDEGFPHLIADPDKRERAIKSVFRWYRPRISATSPLNIETFVVNLEITDVEQILPLFSEQVETYTDLKTNTKRRKPAEVFGLFYLKSWHVNSSSFEKWTNGFTILGDIGVVEFPVPVRRRKRGISQNDPFGYPEALLTLITSFHVRKDLVSGVHHRISFVLTTPPPLFGTGPEIIDKQDEIQLQVWQSGVGPTVFQTNREEDDLETKLRHYADAALSKYQLTDSGEDTYAGIVPTDLDGAIHQVVYSVGPDGAETMVGRNREPNPYYPSFATRRRVEQSRQNPKEVRTALRAASIAGINVASVTGTRIF